MISSRDYTQKRMLSSKQLSPKNAKLANIANRSPTNKFENKAPITNNTLSSRKNITVTKEVRTSLRSPRHSNELRGDSHTTNQASYEEPAEPRDQYYTESNTQQIRVALPEQQEAAPNVIAANNSAQVTKTDGVISITFPNGDIYTGDIQNGKYHGQGEYCFKGNNLAYRGSFLEGRQHGPGVLVNLATNEALYEGGWQEGRKHGSGDYSYGPEEYFNGEWMNDEKVKGFLSFQGNSYSGQWARNKAGGEGTLKLADGTEFKGRFDQNQFVEGTVKYPNGDQYHGQMRNHQRHGEDGSYINQETKIRYRGGYVADCKHGKGTIFYQNGDQLTAIFREGTLTDNEVASYRWKDGCGFQGWFRDGRPHKGTVTWANGQKSEM